MINNVIFIVVFIIILGLIYYLFGLEQVVNNIFLLSLYSIIIATLFFTYVASIEREIVRSQVSDLIDDFTNDYKIVVGPSGSMINIDDTPDTESDKYVETENTKLIKKSFLILGICFAGGFVFCLSVWLITKKYYPNKSFSLKKLFVHNLILLSLVVIIELLFFGLVTRNYKTLNVNETKLKLIETLQKNV